jgi:CrcB protein
LIILDKLEDVTMIESLLLVGLGSFCGGALRYYISMLMRSACSQCFPFATLSVNLAGCLLIGLLLGAFSRCGVQSNSWSLLLTVGFCGGFTTFSTFASESLQMLQNGHILNLVIYIATSVIIGIALVALGYWLVK